MEKPVLDHTAPAQNRTKSAELLLLRASDANHSCPESQRELGLILQSAGQYSVAEVCFQRAIGLRPDFMDAISDLGTLFISQRRIAEAVELYSSSWRAVKHSPGVLMRYAEITLHLHRFEEALSALQRLKALEPGNSRSKILLARAYRGLWKFDRCIRICNEILKQQPNDFDATYCRFTALQACGRVVDAIACGERLLQDPLRHDSRIGSQYLHLLLFDQRDPRKIFEAHRQWAQTYSPAPPPRWGRSRLPSSRRRIRIGFLSHQFGHRYPEIEPLLRHLDRSRFEVICFTDPKPVPPPAERRLARLADEWNCIANLDNQSAAQLIRRKKIDVLFHFDSHFCSDRFPVFAERVAPVQSAMSYYPASSGSPVFDYLITDEHLCPVGVSEHLYTEKLIRIPLFALRQPPRHAPAVRPLPFRQNGYITFGSFSIPQKINSLMAKLWSAILLRVPNSRLLLQNRMGPSGGVVCPEISRRIARLFIREGVDPGRIEFRAQLPLREHLDLYNEIDIGLDPIPFNGMSTTFASLWMGVPVVTAWGDSAVSRVGGSLMSTAGLPDYIAKDASGYVALAVSKALAVEELARLRKGLRKRMANTLLTDGEGFSKSIESACERMLREQD